MKKILAFTLGFAVLVPVLAHAQSFNYVNNWLNQAIYWLRLAITIVMIFMTLLFLWNVFRFVKAKEAADQKKFKQAMINGAIGLFVSVAIWGIIGIAGNILGINTKNSNVYDTPGVTCPPGLRYDSTSRTCL